MRPLLRRNIHKSILKDFFAKKVTIIKFGISDISFISDVRLFTFSMGLSVETTARFVKNQNSIQQLHIGLFSACVE